MALDHALSACLAILLTAVAAVLILMPTNLAVLGRGPEPLLLVVVFIAGTLAVHRQRNQATPPPAAGEAAPARHGASAAVRLRPAGIRFGLATLVILAIAPVFADSAQRIAELTGLGETFVGTLLVGLATSLPELVTCVAAVRIGAFDLAVGNLFGSNAFNMLIFLPMEVVHRGGPLFPLLDSSHAVTAFFAIILMSLGLAAIVYRAKRRLALIEPGSVLMLLFYLLAVWALYAHHTR